MVSRTWRILVPVAALLALRTTAPARVAAQSSGTMQARVTVVDMGRSEAIRAKVGALTPPASPAQIERRDTTIWAPGVRLDIERAEAPKGRPAPYPGWPVRITVLVLN